MVINFRRRPTVSPIRLKNVDIEIVEEYNILAPLLTTS